MLRIVLPVLLAALPLAACASVASPTAKTLSFASMQALNPGVDGEWILAEYPHARQVERRQSGRLLRMGYWVEDPQGATRPLMLHFDAEGVLAQKQYGGPLVRPPEPDESGQSFSFGG